MHVIAAKAVCYKEAMSSDFVTYQKQVVTNAKTLASELASRGFRLVSGGTDTHLMLIDLTGKGMTGKKAQAVLEDVNIVINKNMIPFDKEKPFVTSGIRIGTPALTTRGMTETEMRVIAGLIDDAISNPDCEATKNRIRAKVKDLCDAFPIYGG